MHGNNVLDILPYLRTLIGESGLHDPATIYGVAVGGIGAAYLAAAAFIFLCRFAGRKTFGVRYRKPY